MAKLAKFLQGVAGAAGGAGLNVEDVFSTYLYDGTGYPNYQTITNGIDLATEGGLIWTKCRNNAYGHHLVDTERGVGKSLETNTTNAEQSKPEGVVNFYNDGYRVYYENEVNNGSYNYASWTFRKAPKFFDVVTYTGTGSAQNISHNLGCEPGAIIIKCTSNAVNWAVWHKGTSTPADDYLHLNTTGAAGTSSAYWDSTLPTDTHFTVGAVATNNVSGWTYVAYLFAHNDGDGGFGPTGDQDIIKCGTFEGASATISLGFEPQWILAKNIDTNSWWMMYDNMRGLPVGAGPAELSTNTNAAETTSPSVESIFSTITVDADGFSVTGGYGSTYIYIAIRRGDMGIPEDATKVFDVFKQTNGNGVGNSVVSATEPPFPIDLLVHKWVSNREWDVADRLRGRTKFLKLDNGDAEANETGWLSGFDRMKGYKTGSNGGVFYGTTDSVGYFWKRAAGYFDMVAYDGNNSARTLTHGLTVAPEMIWIKNRTNATRDWVVYHKDAGAGKWLELSNTQAYQSGISVWNNTAPTNSVFSLGSNWANTNSSLYKYIAYLFATCAGVSKVGSYTGNGSTQNIDCGFSSGARFVLIKNLNATGQWLIWDAERGITSNNNDPYFVADSTVGSSTDAGARDIGPYSAGFQLTGADSDINASSNTYIFYAIA